MATCGRGEVVKPRGKEKRRAPVRSAPFQFLRRASMRAKKSRHGDRANDTPLQRIGAFGQSNRMSGNGPTLLLAITPTQRVGWAGVKDDARLDAWRVEA
jgi:hypothetical protein